MDIEDLDYVYEPHTTTDQADYENGAREAWESHELMGDTLDQLEGRYAWIEDPTISDFSAAYCGGYLSQIRNFRAAELFGRILAEETR
ncbi:hypothetical protein [Streptomyces sioyaensis]|uniref:hypothetical protein n=1 Tax=Streptomyces sioyaensis TaxID=67364 RepID=UPI003796AA13